MRINNRQEPVSRLGWRPRSLASVGFRIGVWSWTASAAGAILLVTIFDPRAVDTGLAAMSERLLQASATCFGLGLVLSYIAWKLAAKSATAGTVGWLAGVMVAVCLSAYGMRLHEERRQQRQGAEKWNAGYRARQAFPEHVRQQQAPSLGNSRRQQQTTMDSFDAVQTDPAVQQSRQWHPLVANEFRQEMRRLLASSGLDSLDCGRVNDRVEREIAAGRIPDTERIIADVRAGR
jgi:uncharacterized membrane protein